MIRYRAAREAAPTPPPRPTVAPGVVVVKLRPDVIREIHRRRLPEQLETAFRAVRGRVRGVCAPLSRRPLEAQQPDRLHATVSSIEDVDDPDLKGILVVRLPRREDLQRVCRAFVDSTAVGYCHPAAPRWPQARHTRFGAARDPLANRQWGLRAIRWFETKLPDARGVKVALVDTGVDASHPDLDVKEYVHPPRRPADPLGHGTHVAGILAARTNNRAGIAGVCRPSLHVFKVFPDEPDSEDGEFYLDELLYQRALNEARRRDVRVLNLSLGGTEKSRTEELLIRKLVAAGCVVVAAMGNEYDEGNPVEYPAAYAGVVAVGATDEANRHTSFSNSGKHIALVAPGENILSTLPTKASPHREPEEVRYGAWSGTSMATPHVAGAAALVMTENPTFSVEQVVDRLRSRAASVPGMGRRRWTRRYGDGLLDLRAAVSG